MRYPYRPPFKKNDNKFVFGRLIRDQQVICIDHENTNLGLIDTYKALQIAEEAGLDLVMVSQGAYNKPSTCKILDLDKFKYEQEKRDKLAKKKQRENAIKIKEVKLRPSTDDNDLQTKAKQFLEFVSEGHRLKVTVVFKGREVCHRELGVETMNKFAKMVSAKFDTEPSFSGRNITATLIKNIST